MKSEAGDEAGGEFMSSFWFMTSIMSSFLLLLSYLVWSCLIRACLVLSVLVFSCVVLSSFDVSCVVVYCVLSLTPTLLPPTLASIHTSCAAIAASAPCLPAKTSCCNVCLFFFHLLFLSSCLALLFMMKCAKKRAS